jgi:subtilisin family serine protease
LFTVAAIIGTLVLTAAIPAATGPGPPSPFLSSTRAPAVTEQFRSWSPAAPTAFVDESFPAAGGGRVRVVIETEAPAAARAAVEAAGGRVELTWENLVQAAVPQGTVASLEERPSIELLRAPMRMLPDAIVGEEVAASLAPEWHGKGFTGKGVKVAIIDGGFAGLAERQASGDLPASIATMDMCGGKLATGSSHGTAVAEIVHEMAPDAALYLVCAGTEVEFGAAVAYAKSQGVNIINHSGSWFGPVRGDGSGYFGALVADARAAGILWVNSAGNYAQSHWSGTYVSADGDRMHEFAPGDEGNTFTLPSGVGMCGFLRWDEWPAAVSDFDLLLVKSDTMQVLDMSVDTQSGTQPAVEGLCGMQTSGQNWTVAWFIGGWSVRSNPRIDLFGFTPPFEYQTAAGSLLEPATSSAALAAGALCWQSKQPEPYSSQGPTVDGRTKPDIAGHDSVSGATFGTFAGCGTSGFSGTSAAAPEVAGAAALVKQAWPAYTPDQLQQAVLKYVVDIGSPGTDNVTGAGELRLSPSPDIGPAIGAPTSTPSKPAAGKSFTVVFPVTRKYDGAPLDTATMDCAPKLAGKTLRHAESLKAGKAKLVMTVPKTAKGKQLTVHMKITANGSSATKVAIYKVR